MQGLRDSGPISIAVGMPVVVGAGTSGQRGHIECQLISEFWVGIFYRKQDFSYTSSLGWRQREILSCLTILRHWWYSDKEDKRSMRNVSFVATKNLAHK